MNNKHSFRKDVSESFLSKVNDFIKASDDYLTSSQLKGIEFLQRPRDSIFLQGMFSNPEYPFGTMCDYLDRFIDAAYTGGMLHRDFAQTLEDIFGYNGGLFYDDGFYVDSKTHRYVVDSMVVLLKRSSDYRTELNKVDSMLKELKTYILEHCKEGTHRSDVVGKVDQAITTNLLYHYMDVIRLCNAISSIIGCANVLDHTRIRVGC